MEVVGSIDDNPRKPLKITIMRKLLVDDDSNIANISPNDEDNQDEAKNTSRKRQKKYYSQGQPQEETLDDDKIRAYRRCRQPGSFSGKYAEKTFEEKEEQNGYN
ncbi:hypothetical protein PRIPAC_77031 [Pristionchus pacificus]|uniref:Uncharacterized protein n=1 Tax=Pristionchus pacificus TaxID=54126 RepID=A0A2A6BIA6_PRIPA|nr:hypothetical protein PRIPAC_77031 [Pristionchus pacificus]|eukprot:PDM65566.1 hypothetical protein PRIPAC_52508 [Pristionchus pacificus]